MSRLLAGMQADDIFNWMVYIKFDVPKTTGHDAKRLVSCYRVLESIFNW